MGQLSYTQGLEPGDMVALLHYAAEVNIPIVEIGRVDPDPYVVGPEITVTVGETGVIGSEGYDTDGITPFLAFTERMGVTQVLITPLSEGSHWIRAFGVAGNLPVEVTTARNDYPLVRDLYEAHQPIPTETDPAEPSIFLPLSDLAAALEAARAKETVTP
jgi:hypothetical protein